MPQIPGRRVLGERLGGYIYGTIVVLAAMIEGQQAYRDGTGHVALIVLLTTVVFWLAHVYAHSLAQSVSTGRRVSRQGRALDRPPGELDHRGGCAARSDARARQARRLQSAHGRLAGDRVRGRGARRAGPPLRAARAPWHGRDQPRSSGQTLRSG
jgi:hypothetical protein